MDDAESVTMIREQWNRRAENVDGAGQLAEYLIQLRAADKTTFEIVLPTLCILSAKEVDESNRRELEEICANVLLDSESTRPSRRAVLACLKEFHSCSAWTDFYTLIEALEEPQFHIIRPVLPRFDSLLSAVRDRKLDFLWLKAALFRAILHTNGWIRVWAIEKSVSVDETILQCNNEFITSLIIPNLNNNDVFWRLLEKKRIEEFILQIGSMIDAIKDTPMFLQNLLGSIESLSCPTAIHFVVSTLNNVTTSKILKNEDVPLMRRVILRARYIPHKSIRITTLRNLIVFYAKVTHLDDYVLEEFANFIGYLSCDATPNLIDSIFLQIQECISYNGYRPTENTNDHIFEQLFKDVTQNLELHARMWWISMESDRKLQEKMLSRLQLEVSEILGEKAPRDLTIQLFLLKEKPSTLERSNDVLECMKNDLCEYLLTKLISNEGTKREFQLLHSLYIPLFSKYCPHLFVSCALAVVQVLPEIKSCESTTILLSFFDSIVEKIPENDLGIFEEDFINYLGGRDVIGMKRQKKIVDECDSKEFNNIVATLHSLRIKLLNKILKTVDVDEFLSECIEQLDIASAFPVKQQICHLISRFIRKCTNHELVMNCIRACSNIVNEEKKSLNSLPALECFVNVTLSGPLNAPQVSKESIKYIEAQLSIANQSTPVALILVDALTKYRTNLSIDWAPIIVRLALFGPVPKKETRVISYAYSKIFEKEVQFFDIDQVERLDEVVQTARFKAVLLAIKLSSDDIWTRAFIGEIFKASSTLDQSSSRSFGLSMAHRQKTRGVELLHLLTARIEEKQFASKVFDFCINCVIDPCQQFSIKLIVEWTLAKLCIKFQNLFEKFVDNNFEKNMALQRIGSMCSWLNVLMLISRSAPQLIDTCLDKVIVWCTAQNFPVRCTALAAARLMFSTLDKDRRKKWRLVKAIVNFDAEPSGNSKRVVENLCSDFYFSKLHIDNHFDFQTILTIIADRTGMPPEETIPEKIIKELNSISNQIKSSNNDLEFLHAPSEVYSALSKNTSCAPTMEIEEGMDEGREEINDDDATENINAASFQRKIVKETEMKDDGISLIVVASLVDKPNNLGGICRTSEIFGVDTLVVADVLVAQDSNFKALSMSSENWQKIEGVKPSNLLEYLQNLRANGYTVIAAEQTTDSVMMHDFVFPKKAVIVMGDEKEGVPVKLLRAVDQTVEIKQVGHTRSLNVHVTAALMIAKFAEQVRFAKN